jgi:hypothetical protein
VIHVYILDERAHTLSHTLTHTHSHTHTCTAISMDMRMVMRCLFPQVTTWTGPPIIEFR